MTPPLKNVLIADDDPSLRRLLRQLLTDTGYAVLGSAADGDEVVAMAGLLHPDMVVMDVNMPGLNGIEATRKITALGKSAVVILTATLDPKVARLALDAGASGYMQKGADWGQLAPILESSWHRFQTLGILRSEMRALNENLEVRKLMEKAKGILMEQQGLSEEQAHKTIQKMSQDQGITVKEFCRSLIQVRMVLGMKPRTGSFRKAE